MGSHRNDDGNDSKKEFKKTSITISMGYTATKNKQKKFEKKEKLIFNKKL